MGSVLPATYSSDGLIRVALASQQGIQDPVVTAANDIASQYAQLASSQPVTILTAAKLGVTPRSLDGKINGSTLSAQNLVQVTATGDSSSVAVARAGAATTSLQQYVTKLNAQQTGQYVSVAQSGLRQTNANIAQLSARLAKDSPAGRTADSLVIASLNSTRDQLLGQIARDAAGNQPALQVVEVASPASKTLPKPWLYALVAFVVALIISLRVAYVRARPRPD